MQLDDLVLVNLKYVTYIQPIHVPLKEIGVTVTISVRTMLNNIIISQFVQTTG